MAVEKVSKDVITKTDMDFKNSNDLNICRLKFEYLNVGDTPPLDWYCKLSYYEPTGDTWNQLVSDYSGGYLRNDWYKIKISKIGDDYLKYELTQKAKDIVASNTGSQFPANFEDIERVEIYSTKNPIICPMFFWDEHTVGLT